MQLNGAVGAAVVLLWLLAWFVSASLPMTVAVLTSGPVVPAAMVPLTVIVTEPLAASGPRTQVNVPAAIVHPGLVVVAPVRPAGSGSFTTKPDDPRSVVLETVIVYVTAPPGAYTAGPVLTIPRSTNPPEADAPSLLADAGPAAEEMSENVGLAVVEPAMPIWYTRPVSLAETPRLPLPYSHCAPKEMPLRPRPVAHEET